VNVAPTSLDILIKAQDDASAVLESIQGRIKGLGNEGPAAFSKIEASAEAVRTRVTGLYTAAVALVGAFASSKLLAVPAQFESISAQLETVTKSSAKAEEGMAWVTDFAARTPYELDKVANAFAKLSSYGFDPIAILEPIGNAASGMQKDLDQAVEAFADATRGEFERLKEFGINASTVGNQVTLTWMQGGQQMEKTITKNAENIGAALSGIWTDLFAGGMDRQMETFTGRLSNLLDTVTRSIQRFSGAGLFESVKAKITEVTTALQGLEKSGKLEEWGRATTEQLQKVWELLKTVGTHAVDFMSKWGKLLVVVAGVTAFAKAQAALVQLVSILAKTRLGLVGIFLAIPEMVDFLSDLGAKLYALYVPWSNVYKLTKQSEESQRQANETNKKAIALLNQYAEAQGVTVSSVEDFRRKVADGTIDLRYHAGQVGVTGTAFKALSAEIKKAGEAGSAYVAQVADRYDQAGKEAKALAATEGAAAAAGLAAQKDKYEAVVAVAKSVAAAQIQAVNESAANETQKASLRKQVEQDLQKAKADALKDWLDALKSGLDEALAQEKRYAEEARNAHKTTEEKIRDLKRQTMTESAAYYDQVAEARQKLAAAEAEAAKGTSEGYDNAMKLAKEAQDQFAATAGAGKDIVGNAQAVQTAMDGVAAAGGVWEQAAQNGKDAWAEAAKSLKEQIQEAKAALAELQKQPLSLSVDVDTSTVDKALADLSTRRTDSKHTVDPDTRDAQKAITDLEQPTSSTHTVYVRKVDEYAAGGVARSVPAMVMPGEVVVDPDAARRHGPLLHAINSMSLAREAVARFADGGGVFRPFRRGLVPGVGDEDSEPVLLDEGAFVVRKAAVRHYGSGLLDAIQHSRLPAGVQAFASGGPVLPDWLRRLRSGTPSVPAPAVSDGAPPPAVPTPLSVSQAAPAAFQGLASPLAAPVGFSARGAASVARLDAIRQSAGVRFAGGGSLDEQLADIALERKRTKEDYAKAVASAQGDHDDDLAKLLKQEQEDLDKIAADLAEQLSDLQAAWEEAQADYATALDEAKAAYNDAVAEAKEEWEDQKADLQDALDEAQAAYDDWKKKGEEEHPGYTKTTASRNQTGFVPGGGLSGTKTVLTKDYTDAAKKALADYEAEGKEVKDALQTARSDLNAMVAFAVPADVTKAFTDAKTTAVADMLAARDTFATGMGDARDKAATDTQATRDQSDADKAELDRKLADQLADLQSDFDRAMEDLDIEESRARADADGDAEKRYSISGFSQWLRDGGPVAALARVRRLAEGGVASLLGRLPRFAGGGAVPMPPGAVAGEDSVLAALTPGEGVIRAEAMARILSRKALDALNSLDLDGFLGALPTHRFNAGGVVPGGDLASVSRLAGEGGPAPAGGYEATLHLDVAGKSFETRVTQATADALARQLRRLSVSMK
jgi:hypothetical protein